MISGLLAGIFWGLGTVTLGIATSRPVFAAAAVAAFAAPFVSTFVHQTTSAGLMAGYMALRRRLPVTLRLLFTRSAVFIGLGAIFGGPLGLSFYTASIQLIGPSYSAIITSMYPAVGALFARVFLKERLKPAQWLGLLASIGGVIALGYSPQQGAVQDLLPGFACAIACCVSWSLEAVISAVGLRDERITDQDALLIRYIHSAAFMGIVGVNLVRGWGFAAQVVTSDAMLPIVGAALFALLSYLYYYQSIVSIGAARAMALNITYSAWAMLITAVMTHTLPDLKSVLCAVVIVGGSLMTVNRPGRETA